ncbi:PH domain-containing protein [Ectobacillus panaciterrae]|uniref:PH domain-containing protein n=1 Tax=Ectobacillus panaciterrae TaxID=363872 RepID=UPI0004267772|nr:PH domain-containing protein [Ectobacillus panaciterrae]
MKFSVKKDQVLTGTVFALAPIGLLLFILGIVASGFIAFFAALIGIAGMAAGGFLIWSLSRSYIEITDEHVVNHFGPFQRRVTLDRVRAVRYIKETSLDVTWSFMRVQLWLFPHDVVTIGMPEDEEAFLTALQQKVPDVNITDIHAAL